MYLFKVKDIISFVICTLHLYYSLCLSMFLLSGALLNSQKDERCRRLKNPPQAVWRKWDIFHPRRCVEDFAIKISLFKFCKSTIIALNTTTVQRHFTKKQKSPSSFHLLFYMSLLLDLPDGCLQLYPPVEAWRQKQHFQIQASTHFKTTISTAVYENCLFISHFS